MTKQFVAAGVGLVLVLCIAAAWFLGLGREAILLALGSALAWGGQIVGYFYRKREEG